MLGLKKTLVSLLLMFTLTSTSFGVTKYLYDPETQELVPYEDNTPKQPWSIKDYVITGTLVVNGVVMIWALNALGEQMFGD